MPFPSARPVHPAWSTHHQPVATGTLTGELVIEPAGTGGGWDPVTGPTEGAPAVASHFGPFRAQAIDTEGQPTDAAGQQVTVRSYLIAVNAAAPEPHVGDRVRINACPDDPHLVGKVLTVTGVTYASHRFERDLYADLDLSNQT